MRKMVVFTTMVVACVWGRTSVAIGQPCGAIQNCNPNLAYPYRFCNQESGTAEIRCSNIPNAESGLVPYKVPMPACMKLIATSSDPTSSTMEDVNGNRFDVNISADWADVINNAVDVWNCLCGHTSTNSTLNHCCIPIKWSNNPSDFSGDAQGTLGITYIPGAVTSFASCQPQCVNGVLVMDNNGRPCIYLNNTTEFTKHDPATGLVRRSLYSGTMPPRGPGEALLKPGFVVFSLRDVVTHEFGHWVGMRHPDATPDCAPGVTKTGIMIRNTTANRAPRRLSEEDKCQFMKLYCPTLTSVRWESVANPNPNDQGVELRLTGQWANIDNVDCDITSVVIYDLEGRVIGNPQVQKEMSGKQVRIDFGAVANGPVMVVFYCSGSCSTVRRTFLIVRDN